MKELGFVSVNCKSGIMGKTLHKSLDCLSLRWSDFVRITSKKEADKFKKCKMCFNGERNAD